MLTTSRLETILRLRELIHRLVTTYTRNCYICGGRAIVPGLDGRGLTVKLLIPKRVTCIPSHTRQTDGRVAERARLANADWDSGKCPHANDYD